MTANVKRGHRGPTDLAGVEALRWQSPYLFLNKICFSITPFFPVFPSDQDRQSSHFSEKATAAREVVLPDTG